MKKYINVSQIQICQDLEHLIIGQRKLLQKFLKNNPFTINDKENYKKALRSLIEKSDRIRLELLTGLFDEKNPITFEQGKVIIDKLIKALREFIERLSGSLEREELFYHFDCTMHSSLMMSLQDIKFDFSDALGECNE